MNNKAILVIVNSCQAKTRLDAFSEFKSLISDQMQVNLAYALWKLPKDHRQQVINNIDCYDLIGTDLEFSFKKEHERLPSECNGSCCKQCNGDECRNIFYSSNKKKNEQKSF